MNPINRQALDEYILKNIGIPIGEYSEELEQYIADRNFEKIQAYFSQQIAQNYSDSLSFALKQYYDNLVTNEMTLLAEEKGLQIGEYMELIDIEDVINSTLKIMNLDYKIYGGDEYKQAARTRRYNSMGASVIINDSSANLLDQFPIRIMNNTTYDLMNIESLSSGEKSLLSIASVIMGESRGYKDKLKPRAIVLDEPDAHLHPNYCSLLMKIIKEVFVEEYKMIVFISTHSPITLAVSNVEFGVEMSNGQSIPQAIDISVKKLLADLPYLSITSRGEKYIFVESEVDVECYSKIYRCIQENYKFIYKPLFLQSSYGNGNNDQVKHIISSLNGEDHIHGIIDWDLKNISDGRLHVLAQGKRYTLENSLLDPFCLLTFLIFRRYELPESLKSLANIRIENYLNYERSVIEGYCDILTRHILQDSYNQVSTECRYLGGGVLNINKIYLEMPGHTLESIIYDRLPALRRHGNRMKQEILSLFIDYPETIPLDFKDIFDAILLPESESQ